MRKSINDIFDWTIIIVGCTTLILALFGVDDDFLTLPIVISSGIVLYYSVRAFVLFSPLPIVRKLIRQMMPHQTQQFQPIRTVKTP